MKAGRILLGGVAAVLLVIASAVSPANAQELLGPTPLPPPPGKLEVIPGQYIVELKKGVGRDAFINEHRVAAFRRYSIINGFAARMSQHAADRLAANAQVRLVTPDLVVHAFPRAAGPPGACQPWPECKNGGDSGGGGDSGSCPASSDGMPAQEVPTGVSRIGAAPDPADPTAATGVGVHVAVIDTGIDPCHPDLNVQGGVSFVETEPDYRDTHGHGTHVAGIIGAKDNAFGVVGVAPAVNLYAVKVLDKNGAGALADVIAGIDWAVANGMQVANLSLGALGDLFCVLFGLCGIGPECTAVANAVNAGVTIVVAAGNSADETLYYTPAHCPYSTTVSASADSDGERGGNGSILRIGKGIKEYDDTFAESFSNWSNYCWDRDGDSICTNADSLMVNLMAPGVKILSTFPTSSVTLSGENYAILTGTSMAAPHVTGAAALLIEAVINDTGTPPTPAEVEAALTIGVTIGSRAYTGGECMGVDPPGSTYWLQCSPAWPDDPDFAWEPLLDARDF